eukprot:TRINITY_DN8332_c0_g1_i14.p2 TRINITY_DN8332_c0_g1~~TRINITY_DN8332_c0_g1_i14.p2  ORF type:complete len:183 (+),score=61.72 TRINITY_DN8332_c0_g1_i14:131-679(+)
MKGAFKGIKVNKGSSKPQEKPREFEVNANAEEDKNPYFKAHANLESDSERIERHCNRAIKAFLSNDINKFKECRRELLFIQSRQPAIYVSNSREPDIHRVLFPSHKKNLGDLLEMERDLELDEDLEPAKVKATENDIREDFVREKQESAVRFKGAVFAKDLGEKMEVRWSVFVGRRGWQVQR